ncbi:putative Rossmann fold flavoprotein [Bacilli bacterium PM5-3]|nr:putative Rossmann fold flavoprotein [Bacilli bacterium PM5-3]MDH6603792.1 putative Rossmann fold flavoprotein [Bacilli bacterium PM5-9]
MYDLIIVGGGPCAVMAAIQASKRNKKILIIEQNDDILKKLALSGNGRCNLTNNKNLKDFLQHLDNKKYLYNIIKEFEPKKIIKYFTNLGVELKEEDNNRIFPKSNKAQTIIDALKKELINTEINLNEKVEEVENKNNIFIVTTNKNVYKSTKLLLACGGISYPELGNNIENYNLALSLNHSLVKLKPQECSINVKMPLPDLMGVSLENIEITIKDNDKHLQVLNGDVLFTHYGLSGPGILNSSFSINNATSDKILISLSLFNKKYDGIKKVIHDEITNNPTKNIKTLLKKELPNSLINYLLNKHNIIDVNNAYLKKDTINNLAHDLSSFTFEFKSFYKPQYAFLTGGGINLKEINPKTLESKLVPNLYLGGEMIDICGELGGYNITIALACGYVIGNNC